MKSRKGETTAQASFYIPCEAGQAREDLSRISRQSDYITNEVHCRLG